MSTRTTKEISMNKYTDYFSSNSEHAEFEDLLIEVNALVCAESLNGGEIDTLVAAWRWGLLESGDTPCKSGRAELLKKKVLCQTASQKSDYTFSVTYPFGYKVVMAMSKIRGVKL